LNTVVTVTPEIAFESSYNYAGGLGVLEGDKFLAASEQRLRYLVLTLLYRGGYVTYEFREHDEIIPKPQKQPQGMKELLKEKDFLRLRLKGDEVIVRPWLLERGSATAVFFEAVKPKWARLLTDRVYVERNDEERYLKYVLLAKASAKYLQDVIGLDNIEYIDLQEAYTALLTLALKNFNRFRFIIHTPGPWGHPRFPNKILMDEFGVDFGQNKVILTEIGLKNSLRVFTVSRKHNEIMRRVFPNYAEKMKYVTNGINVGRWMHPAIKEVIVKSGDIESVRMDDFWLAHLRAKEELLNRLRKLKEVKLDLDTPIVLWARRITRYKRPYFVSRFIREIGKDMNAFFLLGGKAHPKDREGIQFMKEFNDLSRKYGNVFFISNYDIREAKLMVSSSDIHLFTPFPGWEACGTSYMKTSVNGVPTLSSRDGGALELFKHEYNSWFFGKELNQLIDIYNDEKAKSLDEEDYEDFRTKLIKLISIYGSNSFKEVSLNLLKSSINFVNIERVLKEYYGE